MIHGRRLASALRERRASSRRVLDARALGADRHAPARRSPGCRARRCPCGGSGTTDGSASSCAPCLCARCRARSCSAPPRSPAGRTRPRSRPPATMLKAPSPTSATAGRPSAATAPEHAGRRPAHFGHAGADLPGARRGDLHVGFGVLRDVADVDVDAAVLRQRARRPRGPAAPDGSARSWRSAAAGFRLPTRRGSPGCARASA